MEKRFKEGFLLKRCSCNHFWENARANLYAFFDNFKKNFAKQDKACKDIDSAKKYLSKYLSDLKLHFDLTDANVQKILIETYNSNKPQHPVVKCLTMLKYWS